MTRILKGNLSRYGLSLPVVELTLLVDMQPALSLVVLIALNFACLMLPLVA